MKNLRFFFIYALVNFPLQNDRFLPQQRSLTSTATSTGIFQFMLQSFSFSTVCFHHTFWKNI